MGDVDTPEVESLWGPPRPGAPAAHLRVYLALLPSGPDAVRSLRLHRARAAVRPTCRRTSRSRQKNSVTCRGTAGQLPARVHPARTASGRHFTPRSRRMSDPSAICGRLDEQTFGKRGIQVHRLEQLVYRHMLV